MAPGVRNAFSSEYGKGGAKTGSKPYFDPKIMLDKAELATASSGNIGPNKDCEEVPQDRPVVGTIDDDLHNSNTNHFDIGGEDLATEDGTGR